MPRSINITGWFIVIFSSFMILIGFFDLLSSPTHQLDAILSSFPQARNAMANMEGLFQYNLIWSIYSIFYFTAVLIGASLFIRRQTIGRIILEITCWIGIINACVDSYLSYILWKKMQIALSSITMLGGLSIGRINPLGTIAIIFGFFMWIIPSAGFILYLRNPKIKAEMH